MYCPVLAFLKSGGASVEAAGTFVHGRGNSCALVINDRVVSPVIPSCSDLAGEFLGIIPPPNMVDRELDSRTGLNSLTATPRCISLLRPSWNIFR